jgi:hypothetical protein
MTFSVHVQADKDSCPVKVKVGPDKKAEPLEMEKAVTGNTVLVACSAPCFPKRFT